MINVPEFILLIKRYETITMEDIRSAYVMGSLANTVQKLTGYGSNKTCTLCKKTKFDCKQCVFKKQLGCQSGVFEESYCAIGMSKNGFELLNSFRARATVLRTYAKKLKISVDS